MLRLSHYQKRRRITDKIRETIKYNYLVARVIYNIIVIPALSSPMHTVKKFQSRFTEDADRKFRNDRERVAAVIFLSQ